MLTLCCNLHYEKFADGTVKCIEDDIPFDLPEGWVWSRLSCICSLIADIDHKMPKAVEDGVLFLSAKDLLNDGTINYTEDVKRISEEDFERLSRKALPQKNDIIYSRIGACLGKARVVKKDIRFLVSYSCCTIRPVFINSVFLASILDGEFVLKQAKGETQSVGVPDLGMSSIKQFLIPIPPTEEQKRINTQLQYALSLAEQLTRDFGELETTISQIKSKILDLAIRGKLVLQNPDDEPASVLLERIRAEKEELIKQGKIKRDKKESLIFKGEDNSYYLIQNGKSSPVDETIVFDLPELWEWTTIPTIANVELGKTLDRAKNTGTLYPYLRSVNIQWGDIDLSDLNEMRFEDNELEKYSVIKNDLLICEGGDVGRCCVWDIDETFLYQNALHRARFYANITPKFYQYVLMSYESKGILKRISNGVTIKHLTGTTLSFMPVPIPPVAEQLRIIAAIESLFAQLDTIAESLN